MNKKVFAIAAALVLMTLWTSGLGYAQSDSPACNNRILAGNYGFTIDHIEIPLGRGGAQLLNQGLGPRGNFLFAEVHHAQSRNGGVIVLDVGQ